MTRSAWMRHRAQLGRRRSFRLILALIMLSLAAPAEARADETFGRDTTTSMCHPAATDRSTESMHALTKLRFTLTPKQPASAEEPTPAPSIYLGMNKSRPASSKLLQAATRLDDQTPVAPRETAFGDAGSWRLFLHLGAASDIKSIDNALVNTGVGFTYFPAKNFSFTTEFNGLFTSEQGETAAAANINLLMRFHFIAKESWSVYFDAGAGVMLASDEVPRMGSNFNFTPQIGVGASLDIGNDTRLMGGVRWHHISNANTHRDNPGRDSFLLYLGLSVPLR